MVRLQDLPEEFRQQVMQERRRTREHAVAVVEACKAGHAERFYHLAYPYDDWPSGFWTPALRIIARSVSKVTPEIQAAFQQIWIETKMLNMRCDDHRALCQALRILMPKYNGPELRLYRGAAALERRRRQYGISWTSSLSAAEEFAEGYRKRPEGSVVLETIAMPAAIISAVEYPPPITKAEKVGAGLPPNAKVTEWHEECEYLVDRRLLGPVTVLRRYLTTQPARD